MSLVKRMYEEKETEKLEKRNAQLEGYRKKLLRDGEYEMPCPYCGYSLSKNDVKKPHCIHCNALFKWNEDD